MNIFGSGSTNNTQQDLNFIFNYLTKDKFIVYYQILDKIHVKL